MSEKEYITYLSPDREDRFRYFHSLQHGKIVRFCVQYEAFITGKWHAIVRYDTAHDSPHRDLLNPDGTQEKQVLHGYSAEEILALGERDLKTNWKRYRVEYEKRK